MRAVVPVHGFPDLTPERAVLEPLGIAVIDGRALEAGERLAAVRTADALLIQSFQLDAALIASLEHCRVIGAYGVGYDQIDVLAASRRDITVVHVPDYGTEEVSDHALALLLACARGLGVLAPSARRGEWTPGGAGPLHRLRGRILGIVGLGRIGRRVAAKALAFGLRVLAHDPYLPGAVFAAHGVEACPLDRLLAEADFVSLHVPLTPETRGLIGPTALEAMKPGAYLVNVARGLVVDEEALVRALDRGRLAGAGLDVLAVEPPAPDHPLLRHPRVLVTPHSAWYTEEAMADLQRLLAEDVARVLAGQPARCPVSPDPTLPSPIASPRHRAAQHRDPGGARPPVRGDDA